MKLYYSIFLLLNSFLIVYSQSITKDSLSNESIPFVEIYSERGDFIGITDQDGKISNDLKIKVVLSKSNSLIFVHPAYKTRELNANLLGTPATILLSPMPIALNEVLVSSKSKTSKYLRMRGYFRSVQINENKPHYYIDGIVEYYVSMKSKKTRMKIVSNRSLENKLTAQLSSKYFFLLAGVPSFNDFIDYENLSGGYIFENSKNEIIIKDGESNNKGIIKKYGDGTMLQLEIISSDNPKVMKFIEMESVMSNYSISAAYDSDIAAADIKNLIYYKERRTYNIKRKQKDHYTKVEATHEFFLLDKEYVNEMSSKGTDDYYSFKTPSQYTENYWQNVDNKVYQPLSKSVELYIGENLSEIKKK